MEGDAASGTSINSHSESIQMVRHTGRKTGYRDKGSTGIQVTISLGGMSYSDIKPPSVHKSISKLSKRAAIGLI